MKNKNTKNGGFISLMFLAPFLLFIAFSVANFQSYVNSSYSILTLLISLCYILLWVLLFYATLKSKSITVSVFYCFIWIICLSIVFILFFTDPYLKIVHHQASLHQAVQSFMIPNIHFMNST